MTENNKLPWIERVGMLSINPEAATVKDVMRMSAELLEFLDFVDGLKNLLNEPLTDEEQKIVDEVTRND